MQLLTYLLRFSLSLYFVCDCSFYFKFKKKKKKLFAEINRARRDIYYM